MLPRPKPSQSVPTYFFVCEKCRHPIHVEPKQAGSKIDCRCGHTSVVPSVIHLQRLEPSPGGAPPVGTGFSGAAAPTAAPFAQPALRQAGTVPNCPFCARPMQHGRIIGERYQLKWLAAEIPLTLGIWVVGGHPIGQGGFMQFNRPHVWGWRCHACAKIIVDERS